jgi:P-type Ca2+ transporter type 2C
LTPAMVRTIFITAAFFIVVMLGLLIAMQNGYLRDPIAGGKSAWSVEVAGTRLAVPYESPDLKQIDGESWTYQGQPATVNFTVYQVSLFFSIYVFFQVWNQINARSLTPDMSGFERITQNPTFITIAAIVAIGQIAIVTFGGAVFNVEPLSWADWLVVIVVTSSVLLFAEIARRLRQAS